MTESGGFFNSTQIETAQRVFKFVLAKDWFDRTHDNEQALSKFIAHCLQKGMADIDELGNAVESVAKIKWSKANDLMAWPIKASLADD